MFYFFTLLSRGTISIIFYVYKVCLCVCRSESAPCCLYYFVYMSIIFVLYTCILFLAVVYRGPHGRLAFFFSINVLPSENKDYYYYYYYYTFIDLC